MVINEIIPDRLAAIIGRMVKDPKLQTNIASLLVKLQPANVLEAEQIVDQARSAGVSRGTQSSLFGDEDVAESLYLERARVLDRSSKMLRRNATTFRTLLDQEGEIAGAGNVLDQTSNAARLEEDQRIMSYVRAQANRKGSISDALSDAARSAKETGQYQQPARDFLKALTRAIKDGELARETGPRNRVASEFTEEAQPFAGRSGDAAELEQVVANDDTISMFDEPVGPGAVKQSAAMQREIMTADNLDEIRGVEIPVGERIDTDGTRVSETSTVGQIMDDIEADEEFLSQLEACNGGAS